MCSGRSLLSHIFHAMAAHPVGAADALSSITVNASAIPLLLISFILTLVLTLLYRRYSSTLLRLLSTSPSHRAHVLSLSQSLIRLRRQLDALNSPATFAEYAKTQRQMAQLTKTLEQAHAAEAASISRLLPVLLLYAPAAAATAAMLWAGWGAPLVHVDAPQWLAYTPAKVSPALLQSTRACALDSLSSSPVALCPSAQWLVHDVGMVGWLFVSHRVSQLLLASTAQHSPTAQSALL